MKFGFQQLANLFFSLVVLYLLFRAYTYLGNMRGCSCAPQPIAARLRTLELVYIALLVVGIVARMNSTTLLKFLKQTGKIIYAISIVVLVALFAMFIYNVHSYYLSLPEKCDCAKHMERYILYIQAIYYFIPLALLLLSFVFGSGSKLVPVIAGLVLVGDLVYLNNQQMFNNYFGAKTEKVKEVKPADKINQLSVAKQVETEKKIETLRDRGVPTPGAGVSAPYSAADSKFSPA